MGVILKDDLRNFVQVYYNNTQNYIRASGQVSPDTKRLLENLTKETADVLAAFADRIAGEQS